MNRILSSTQSTDNLYLEFRPNQGKKTKRKRTKESESSKKPSTTKETPKGKAPSKGSKNSKSASAKEPVEEPIAEVVMDDAGEDVVRDDDQPQDTSEPKTDKTSNPEWFKQPLRPPTPDPEWNKCQVVLGPTYNHLKGTCTSSIKLKYNFQECFNALTDKLDWNNLEGDRYPFDLSKSFPLQENIHYINHEDKSSSVKIVGIENMVPTLWSPTKVAYDKDAEKGIKHWGERRKLWHRSQMNKFSKHKVYSTQKILSVKSVSVKKLHGYGHLEEIVVKRADRQLYKFKEGNFVDLHLNDIEDMLLLAVQQKLFHLNDSDIVDFIVALRMFTRSLIIKKRVEDLQLGVESYQKKLNITALHKTFPEIEFKEIYTLSYNPPGVIYEDLNKQKRVMWVDELYKFSDETLKKVRDKIHHRVLDFHLGCNNEMLRRKWTAIDRKRSQLMVELMDKQMRERRINRNFERLVGARELKKDYKLMTRTV
ncbi:hypothetical protein Tco_0775636 [Tanacetum coccineum]